MEIYAAYLILSAAYLFGGAGIFHAIIGGLKYDVTLAWWIAINALTLGVFVTAYLVLWAVAVVLQGAGQ